MTQRQAAEELGISERQVRRLLVKMRRKGDGAVIHELRGRRSNRRSKEEMRQKAIEVLKQDVYRGFGPTLAAEYLVNKHQIAASNETVRKWMREAGLWRAHTERIEQSERLFRLPGQLELSPRAFADGSANSIDAAPINPRAALTRSNVRVAA